MSPPFLIPLALAFFLLLCFLVTSHFRFGPPQILAIYFTPPPPPNPSLHTIFPGLFQHVRADRFLGPRYRLRAASVRRQHSGLQPGKVPECADRNEVEGPCYSAQKLCHRDFSPLESKRS